jgi:enamine deaminase RidA (YjgF/YER057c/UK114 family)
LSRNIQPEGWPRPGGYSNGVAASGELLFVAGQVGWDETETMVSDDLVEQIRQALENVVTVLRAGGAGPEHVTRMTWYVIDLDDYKRRTGEVGGVYRTVMGSHYPAMSLVGVAGLVEDGALVEIEATAVIPKGAGS